MLALNCLIVTNDCKVVSRVVVVDIPPDRRVGILLEEIKKKAGPPEVPDIIAAHSLIPWKLDTPFPTHPSSAFANHVNGLYLNSEVDDTSLDLGAPSGAYFTDPPASKVHIIIQLPPERSFMGRGPVQLDLPQVEGEAVEHDTYENLLIYLGASRYVLDDPSTMSKPSMFQSYQNTENCILNDRPSKNVKVPPVALLYQPFGEYIDSLLSDEEPAMNLRNLQSAVTSFRSVMCKHFLDEKNRREEVLEALNNIFRSYEPFKLPPIVPNKVSGDRTSDGHANGPANVMETVVEVKNEFGVGSTDPEIRYTSYFMQMNYSQIRSGMPKNFFEKHLCPTLGICITGSYIGFGALLLLDKARHVPLAIISARSPSGDHSHGPALFRSFLAACVLRARIHEDMRRVLYNPLTPPRIRDRNLPRIQKILAWPPTDEQLELEFDILRVACQDDNIWYENRFIYLARMQRQEVLVKFTRQYCPKLHSFCAQRNHAPKLLGYGSVPGGWNVVVMELVKHDRNNRITHAPKHWTKWEQDLTRLVQDFHDEGLVHGDLRAANFIVPTDRPEDILLIDFDWGGEAGKASFPTWELTDELADETATNRVITKDHDVRVLKAALGRLKPIAGTGMGIF